MSRQILTILILKAFKTSQRNFAQKLFINRYTYQPFIHHDKTQFYGPRNSKI